VASVLVQCRLLPFLAIVRYACMNLEVSERRKARLRLPGYDLEICDKVSANAADSICVQQCSPLCDNLNFTTDETLDDAKNSIGIQCRVNTAGRDSGRNARL
jgi:hypothetical protein